MPNLGRALAGAATFGLLALSLVAAERADGPPGLPAQIALTAPLGTGPIVGRAIAFTITPPLSTLAVPQAPATPVAPFEREMPEPLGDLPDDLIAHTPGITGDEAVQRGAPIGNMPAVSASF